MIYLQSKRSIYTRSTLLCVVKVKIVAFDPGHLPVLSGHGSKILKYVSYTMEPWKYSLAG